MKPPKKVIGIVAVATGCLVVGSPASANDREMAIWSAKNRYCSLVASGAAKRMGDWQAMESAVNQSMKTWGNSIGLSQWQLREAVQNQIRAEGC
jgi:hypothetical protein